MNESNTNDMSTDIYHDANKDDNATNISNAASSSTRCTGSDTIS